MKIASGNDCVFPKMVIAVIIVSGAACVIMANIPEYVPDWAEGFKAD